MTRYTGSVKSRSEQSTSLGAHVRALAEVLVTLVADEAEGLPSERRVRLRGHLSALVRAYPEYLALSESDLAQAMAEADGEEIHDAP
jgi:hypothetical protein